jgi:hypothetical protein
MLVRFAALIPDQIAIPDRVHSAERKRVRLGER